MKYYLINNMFCLILILTKCTLYLDLNTITQQKISFVSHTVKEIKTKKITKIVNYLLFILAFVCHIG